MARGVPSAPSPIISLVVDGLTRSTITQLTLGNSPTRAVTLADAKRLRPLLSTCTSLTALTLHTRYIHSDPLHLVLSGASSCRRLSTLTVVGGISLRQSKAIADALGCFSLGCRKTPTAVSHHRRYAGRRHNSYDCNPSCSPKRRARTPSGLPLLYDCRMAPTRAPSARCRGALKVPWSSSPRVCEAVSPSPRTGARARMAWQTEDTSHRRRCSTPPSSFPPFCVHVVLSLAHLDDAAADILLEGFRRSERVVQADIHVCCASGVSQDCAERLLSRLQTIFFRNHERVLSRGIVSKHATPPVVSPTLSLPPVASLKEDVDWIMPSWQAILPLQSPDACQSCCNSTCSGGIHQTLQRPVVVPQHSLSPHDPCMSPRTPASQAREARNTQGDGATHRPLTQRAHTRRADDGDDWRASQMTDGLSVLRAPSRCYSPAQLFIRPSASPADPLCGRLVRSCSPCDCTERRKAGDAQSPHGDQRGLSSVPASPLPRSPSRGGLPFSHGTQRGWRRDMILKLFPRLPSPHCEMGARPLLPLSPRGGSEGLHVISNTLPSQPASTCLQGKAKAQMAGATSTRPSTTTCRRGDHLELRSPEGVKMATPVGGVTSLSVPKRPPVSECTHDALPDAEAVPPRYPLRGMTPSESALVDGTRQMPHGDFPLFAAIRSGGDGQSTRTYRPIQPQSGESPLWIDTFHQSIMAIQHCVAWYSDRNNAHGLDFVEEVQDWNARMSECIDHHLQGMIHSLNVLPVKPDHVT